MQIKAFLPSEGKDLAEEDFRDFSADVMGKPVTVDFGPKIGTVKDVIRADGGVHLLMDVEIDLSETVFQPGLAFKTDNKWEICEVSLVPAPDKV